MQQLIHFIRRYKYFLLFISLELFALGLIVNNHHFHKVKVVSSANSITGAIYNKMNDIYDYFNLKNKNEELVRENEKLKNKIEKISLLTEDSLVNVTILDTVNYRQEYNYIGAEIIKNDFNKTYNFITVNRGKNEGVTTEMAIINGKGIIGITDQVSDNYARVQSILNKNSKINARLKNNKYFGTLTWNAKNYNVVQLIDIPKQAVIKRGDTVVTGGMSTIFPEGIPIGTVINKSGESEQFQDIDVQLFNDMSNIGYVYIVKNLHKNEIKKLEKAEQK